MKRDNDIDHWWQRWFEARDPSARDRLIVHYSPLVKFVAGRVGAGLPNSVDPGDLVSAGVFGLIDAVERFDPDAGVKFETFAVPRIRGAVFDGLRSLDWVPRSVRSRAREVETAFTELESRHGRAPTDDELSAHLKITAPEFQKWLAAIASTTVGPLDRALVAGAEPRTLSGDVPDYAGVDRRGRRGAPAGARRGASGFPIGRSWSCRCTTTRVSPSPRSAACSASPRAGSRRSTPRRCCTCVPGCRPPGVT